MSKIGDILTKYNFDKISFDEAEQMLLELVRWAYVVEYCDGINHEDCCGVFSSKDRANEYIAKRKEPKYYGIQPMVVDLEEEPLCECSLF